MIWHVPPNLPLIGDVTRPMLAEAEGAVMGVTPDPIIAERDRAYEHVPCIAFLFVDCVLKGQVSQLPRTTISGGSPCTEPFT